MNPQTFFEAKLVFDLGITLLHSLWQIAAVLMLVVVGLRILQSSSPKTRYVFLTVGLLIAVGCPIMTFIQVSNRSGKTDIVDSIVGTGIDTPEERVTVGSDPSMTDTAHRSSQALFGPSGSDSLANLIESLPDLLPFATYLWLIGVAVFSFRLVGGLSRLRTYRRIGSSDVDSQWKVNFRDLCRRSGIGRAVRIVQSTLVETPIAVGTIRPLIIVPASLFLQISPAELELIIAHELIHIRRLDPLVNLFQCFVETIFFYHPAIWWISREIRREREFAADAAVVELFENSYVKYARALANLEEIRQSTKQQMPQIATAANGGQLMNRIQKILNVKTEMSSASSAWTAGMALLLTSVFLLATFSFSSSRVVNGSTSSGERKIAIGFVGIPPLDRTANPPKDSDATARLLIQKLKEYKVPATGFLTGSMVSDGDKLYPVRANIARLWLDAGLELGLGGFKHLKFYDTATDEYIANIEKNERVAKQIVGNSGLPPRYFSYPFLNTGKTVQDRARVESWLTSRGYEPVKYTVDNQEWMYSYAYDMARNDNDVHTMREIREAYLSYMAKMMDHYEAYSQEMFGRDIAQTMVLTSSRLITDTADEFFAMLSKRGYKFVSMEEAQADPAYKSKEDYSGDAGISWFERWTMAKGKKLRTEPEVDTVVQQTWEARGKTAKR